MKLQVDRLKQLVKKRSIFGWILFIFGFGWRRLGDWQSVEWLADHLPFTKLVKAMVHFHPDYVSIGIVGAAFVWLTFIVLWPKKETLPPEPPTQEPVSAKEPILKAHFVRSHLMPRSAWQTIVDGAFRAVGRDQYDVECDFLYEVFIVNTTNNPVTIKKFTAEVQLGQDWKELKRLEDPSDYRIQISEDSRSPTKDLVSLAKTLDDVPLTRGVGHRGWLRFEFVTTNKNLQGEVHSKVKIIDALGGEHEVSTSELRDSGEGALIHNPDHVFNVRD